MGTSDDVERVAAPLLQTAGLDLVDVEFRSGNIVVTVDREGGIDLDTLASMSRAISAAIDREGVGPPSRYELEVSSPGLERRLRRPEHFRRFVGHQISLRTVPGVDGERRLEGELASADDHGIVVTATRVGRRRPSPRLRRHRKSPHGLRLEGGVGRHALADSPQRAPRREPRRRQRREP